MTRYRHKSTQWQILDLNPGLYDFVDWWHMLVAHEWEPTTKGNEFVQYPLENSTQEDHSGSMDTWALYEHEAIHVPNTLLSSCPPWSIRLDIQRVSFLRDTHHKALPFPYPCFKHVLWAQAT